MSVYKPKKYFIKTYGCQANVADSNSMVGILEALGFEEAKTPKMFKNEMEFLGKTLKKTDLFIVNSCSVRQKSEDKVYGLGKVIKEVKNKPFVILAGCMVGSATGKRKRFGIGELKKKTPWVDLYINPTQVFDLPNILKRQNLLSDWAEKKLDQKKLSQKKPSEKHVFVNVSSGCDNFCAFCVVPYARGEEISRDKKEILAEIKHLVDRGAREVTLCGQNVNSWNLTKDEKFEIRSGSSQKLPFAALLREVHEIAGIEKIDFISSNPFDFTMDLVDTLKMPKISHYLHIAVQSGNNDVLSTMNRRHTLENFLDLVKAIKRARPEVELGTDVIVGFPGETKEQFMDTVKLFKKVKFNVAFISMYSPRKGTPAERLYKDDVPLKEKKRRHAYLTKVWKESKS